MKKKFLAITAVVMMFCFMAVSANAASPSLPSYDDDDDDTPTGTIVMPKPAPETDKDKAATAETADGKKVDVKVLTVNSEAAPAELKEAYKEITSAPSVEKFLESAGIAVEEKNLAVESVLDVSVDVPAGTTVDVTFKLPNIKAGDTVVVLHKGANGWEKLPAVVKDGEVIATFASFSPVAILVETEPAVAPDTGANTGTVKSPQTGDYTYSVIACGVAVLAAAVVFTKKRHAA